jgi:hypothetical protein
MIMSYYKKATTTIGIWNSTNLVLTDTRRTAQGNCEMLNVVNKISQQIRCDKCDHLDKAEISYDMTEESQEKY